MRFFSIKAGVRTTRSRLFESSRHVSLGFLLAVGVPACGSFSSAQSNGTAGTNSANGGDISTSGGVGGGSTNGGATSSSGGTGGVSSTTPACQGLVCNGACVDSKTDSSNCGACGTVCATGQSCTNGTCGCSTGQLCSGSCTNLQTDAANCGACSNKCGAGQGCNNGTCGCSTGQSICSGTCTNLQTDAANCGTCAKACSAQQTCQSGACACTTGLVVCAGGTACIDTNTDPANCGACGTPCAASQVCSAGKCVTTCGASLTACTGACVDLTSDIAHCGSCTTACSSASGQTCSASACKCTTGLSTCSGSCKNLQTDVANCGTCGTACGTGQTCTAGACACSTAGQSLCSGSCKTLQTDAANCGACGTVCGTGQTCTAGACVCSTTGQSLCSGSCKNLQTDVANCGTCGKVCTTGQTCTAGVCTTTCATGQTLCSGTCKNLQTDVANCGTCGTVCATGQTCTAGVCTTPVVQTVCDILKAAGNTCVSAHSTARLLVSTYTGPLYQVCKGTFAAGPSSCKGTMQDIASVGGYADSATQDTFCAGGSCTITKIYDQSGQGNDLEPAPRGGAKNSPDNPASATALKTTLGGHSIYGILITPGVGYRTGCSGCTIKTGRGTATGDQAETTYMVTSQQQLVNGCCFDYGNGETTSNDDGNGTMDAIYFGGGVVWGTGSPGGHNNGPWVMGDLENGLYAGWENNQDQNISTNTPLKFDFVTAMLVGDTCTGATGCAGTGTARPNGRFALYGGDATAGTLKTEYDGPRPYAPGRTGYVPMKKQGSIILGIGGDNSDSDGGRFYEGVMATGAATLTTLNAVQANIVAAKYGK